MLLSDVDYLELFDAGKQHGAKYLLIFFHATEFPPHHWSSKYVYSKEELQKEINTSGGSVQLKEIFSYSYPIQEQITSHPPWFID